MMALGEPTRFRIAEFLSSERRSVTDICRFLSIDQPLVSKHLRVLRSAGVVGVQQSQRNRLYALESAPLKELSEWTEKFRSLWDARYSAIDAILDELKEPE